MSKKNHHPVSAEVENNPLYHDTYKLLRCYRDSTYSLMVAVRQVIRSEYRYILSLQADKGDNIYFVLGHLQQEMPCISSISATLRTMALMCDSGTQEPSCETMICSSVIDSETHSELFLTGKVSSGICIGSCIFMAISSLSIMTSLILNITDR